MAEGPRFCCGKCSVRAGTITIAISWLVLNALNIAAYVLHLWWLSDSSNGNPFAGWWAAWDEAMARAGLEYDQFPMVKQMRELVEEMYTNHRVCLAIFTYLSLIGAVLNVGLSKLLLFAALKNDGSGRFSCLMLPWILVNGIGLVITAAAAVPLVVYTGIYFGVLASVLVALEVVLILAVYGYIFWIVGLYWSQLRKGCEGSAERSEPEFDAVRLLKKPPSE